jgi:hypothetical protein
MVKEMIQDVIDFLVDNTTKKENTLELIITIDRAIRIEFNSYGETLDIVWVRFGEPGWRMQCNTFMLRYLPTSKIRMKDNIKDIEVFTMIFDTPDIQAIIEKDEEYLNIYMLENFQEKANRYQGEFVMSQDTVSYMKKLLTNRGIGNEEV